MKREQWTVTTFKCRFDISGMIVTASVTVSSFKPRLMERLETCFREHYVTVFPKRADAARSGMLLDFEVTGGGTGTAEHATIISSVPR